MLIQIVLATHQFVGKILVIVRHLFSEITATGMNKYLSVITNFGCHGRCPYCIVRENGIKVPKSTVDGLDKLEDAIALTGANIVSISGGGDPLYRYSGNPLVPKYLGMVMGITSAMSAIC